MRWFCHVCAVYSILLGLVRSTSLPGTLQTLVGGYTYNEDGGATEGLATLAHLNRALGLTVDSIGNLYIADTSNHVIRKVVVATGYLTTVVGTGVAGSATDASRRPTSTQLNGPISVAVTGDGTTLYIADTNNFAVRAVSFVAANNVISTVVGTLGVQASEGWSGHYFQPVRATAATLVGPIALCLSPSGRTLYFTNNYAIYRWNTTHIALYAGGWSGGDSCPADGNGVALKSCAATDARFAQTPSAIHMDASSNLYVADYGMHTIRKVGPDGMVSVFR